MNDGAEPNSHPSEAPVVDSAQDEEEGKLFVVIFYGCVLCCVVFCKVTCLHLN